MIIDASKLQEVLPDKSAYCKYAEERFYKVPGYDKLALSDYCQLLYDQKQIIKHKYISGVGECFKVDGEILLLDDLIIKTFLANIPYNVYKLIWPNKEIKARGNKCKKYEYKMCIRDMHILRSQDDLVEFIVSRFDHRNPRYPGYFQECVFVNRVDGINHYKILTRYNAIIKRRIDICDAWRTDYFEFGKWFLANAYNYSGKYGDLQVDSDLMSLGIIKRYAPETSCLLPQKINQIIWQMRKLKRPEQALKRADKLRTIIEYECPRKEIPEYIINKLVEIEQKYRQLAIELID